MPKYMKNFITLAGVIIVGSFLVFLYNCIVGLSDFAGRLNPIFEPWVFWGLFAAVALMLGWAGGVAFLRPRPMLVYASPTEGDLAKLRQQLVRRLRKNRYLREAGVCVEGEGDLEVALGVLESKADEEIQGTAKRVFIGSAVAQNGRLDTLVVLFLVTRMAWRISRIYNQRPHYRELVNLYANIAATSFLAGSIEDFGIDEYVAELMTPLMGGSAIGAVPGAQAIAGMITQSILTGSTNCLLALRCGIIARNYMSLKLDGGGSMRRSATLEASKLFVSMSAETVTYVTKLLVKGASGAVKSGAGKVGRGVGSVVSGATQSVKGGARSAGQGIKTQAGAVVGGVTGGVARAADASKVAATRVSKVVGVAHKSSVEKVEKAAQSARKVAVQSGAKIVDTARGAVDMTVGRIRNAGESVGTKAISAVDKVEMAARGGKETLRKLVDIFKRQG